MLIEAKCNPARLFNKVEWVWSEKKQMYFPVQSGAATGTAMTDYLELRFLNHFFNKTASSTIAQPYLALYTSNPGEAAASGTEATSGSYARTAINFNSPAPSAGAATNELVTFPTASADWSSAANITGWQIMDASTSGNGLAYGTFTVAQPVLSGNTFSVPAGNLILTAD